MYGTKKMQSTADSVDGKHAPIGAQTRFRTRAAGHRQSGLDLSPSVGLAKSRLDGLELVIVPLPTFYSRGGFAVPTYGP